MVDGIEDGVAANGVTTYMEEEARRYFESGKATFMRNWPYAYELGNAKGSTVRGKFDVAPLPSFEGGGKAGILGGHDMVISVFSENPGAALMFIDFVTSRDQ
jgi:ABC-type glycerol-3-phosphate transport system substrate-binding protein